MPYFPIFLDLLNKDVLVIGAGDVATRKVEKLIPFGPRIRVIADRISHQIRQFESDGKLICFQKTFEMKEIQEAELVIVAVDDLMLQSQVYEQCRIKKIPCNSVDSPSYCSFIFPALVTQNDLSIGISTGGQAPGVSSQVRALIEKVIPDNMGEIIFQVKKYRQSAEIKSKLKFTERAQKVNSFVSSLLNQKGKTIGERD